MTIRHIVLLPFKKSLLKQDIEQVMTAIGDLKKSIPQILSFSWGENNSIEHLEQGYFHGFVMEFKDEEARGIYLNHPEHVRVVQSRILPALEGGAGSALVFDYYM